MKNMFVISKYTFMEACRDRFVWFVFVLMLLGIPIGLFIRNIMLYGVETALPSVVLAVISLSLICVSVLYVNIATRRELDGRVMHVIISTPVSNLSYIVGKIFGFWFFSFIYIALGFALVVLLNIAPIKYAVVNSIALMLLQLLIIAWSFFFALLLGSISASVIASLCSWMLFINIETMWILSRTTIDRVTMYLGKYLYYILPNYERYDFKHVLLYNNNLDLPDFLYLFPYTIAWLIFVIAISLFDFSRKEY